MSRVMHKDPEIESFLDENTDKIQELKKWAAVEISKEPSDSESAEAKVAALSELRVKAITKVESEWFVSIDHPKKDRFKDIVMLNIECIARSILDKDPSVVKEFLGPEPTNKKGRNISDLSIRANLDHS
jgi:hypothetical protein